MQRRRFLFEHRSRDQPAPTPQSHDSVDMCPVCSIRLPPDDGSRVAHIDGCLREQQQGSLAEGGGGGGGRGREEETANDSDSESYEEYTWCNTTRIRTTSMLSPQTRASRAFYLARSYLSVLVAYLCVEYALLTIILLVI